MKTIKITILLLFACLISMNAVAQAQESVQLTNGEWPPWLSKDLKHHGVLSRIVTEAFALEGIQVTYGFFPWKRAYHEAKRGTYDGSVVWSKNADREADFYFSDAIFSDEKVLFHLKTSRFDWNTTDDLRQMEIGATLGYSYGSAFDGAAAAGRLKVNYVARDEQNLRMLLSGRIHVFPCNLRAGYELIHNKFKLEDARRFTHHPKILYAKPYHLIISRKTGERGLHLIRLFNNGLRRLRESGKIQQFFIESENGTVHSNK